MKNLLLSLLFAATAFAENPVELRYVPQTTPVYLGSMTNDVISKLDAVYDGVIVSNDNAYAKFSIADGIQLDYGYGPDSQDSYYVTFPTSYGAMVISTGDSSINVNGTDYDLGSFITRGTSESSINVNGTEYDLGNFVTEAGECSINVSGTEYNLGNFITRGTGEGSIYVDGTEYDLDNFVTEGDGAGSINVNGMEYYLNNFITRGSVENSIVVSDTEYNLNDFVTKGDSEDYIRVGDATYNLNGFRDFDDVGFSQIVVTNDLPSVSVLCLTNNFQTSYLTDQIYFKTNALDPASVYSIKFPEEGGTFARMEDLTVLEASIREEAEDTWRKAVSNSIVIGRLAEGPASYITNGVEVSDYAVAVGNNAKALSYGDTAIGHCAYATNHHSIAIGKSATALLPESIAIGGLVGASPNPGVCGSVAIGHNSAAEDGSKGVALGYWAWSKGNNSTALGSHAYALAPGSVQIGVGVNNTPNTIKYHDQYLATQAFVMQALTNLVTTGITVNGKTYKLVEVTQ